MARRPRSLAAPRMSAPVPIEQPPRTDPQADAMSTHSHHDAGRCPPSTADVPELLDRAADDLHFEFQGFFARETIRAVLSAAHADLRETTRVHTHLVALATRSAHEYLSSVVECAKDPLSSPPEVLFVCVRDAGRSQMAAEMLQHRARSRVNVRLAGSAPAGTIGPATREAMAEFGVELQQEGPEPLGPRAAAAADVVVTTGRGDTLPLYPGKRYLDWEVEDPAGKPIEEVRGIRNDIDRRVTGLLAELV
ncbi:arsenate-mycothiol transferase ArsC [Salinifilum ghardaiensis]